MRELVPAKDKGLAAAETMAQEMRDGMLQLALLIRESNERIAALEEMMHEQVKVTPAQASVINREIRQRAAEVCRIYGAAGSEKDAAAAIRRALTKTSGAGCVRDLRRCDYEIALKAVRIWEDYKVMMKIKNRRADT